MDENDLKELLQQLIDQQKKKLLSLGREFVPYLTPEDLLQPNDYPELENNPHFRYEEGLLDGLQSMQTAIQTQIQHSKYSSSKS